MLLRGPENLPSSFDKSEIEILTPLGFIQFGAQCLRPQCQRSQSRKGADDLQYFDMLIRECQLGRCIQSIPQIRLTCSLARLIPRSSSSISGQNSSIVFMSFNDNAGNSVGAKAANV